MTITVYVGDNDESIAVLARQNSPDAFLVEHLNFEQFLKTNKKNITVYTSLSDLPKITNDRAVLYEILNKADVIYYAPPKKWSDQETDFFSNTSKQSLTLFFLFLINNQKNNVVNLDLSDYTDNQYIFLESHRTNQTQSIWSAGCSIAHGVGIDPDFRYAKLVSTVTNLPLIDLSKGGSSIEHAADQILRSNIRKDEIVIWGLTEETRHVVWNSNTKKSAAGEHNVYTLTETRIYKSLISVHQVVNFCSKIGAKLILLPIICSENFCLLLSELDEFYQLPFQTKFIDYGSDNLHPGPMQHKMYADFCLKIIQNNC